MFNTAKKLALLLFALGAAVILTSCEPSGGPKLTSECDYSTPVSVSVVEYATEGELKAYYESVQPWMAKERYSIKGFATKNIVTGAHTLHIMKIRGQTDRDRIETLGHELMHSFCGEWHPPTIKG